MVEKCITLAKKARAAELAASEFATDAERGTEAWKQWREGEQHAKWVEASAPAVNARRRLFQTLRDKEAVSILVDVIAERFEDRDGGYTRIMRLATPRLGDAGVRAILELVGKNDRVAAKSEKPAFASDDAADTDSSDETAESASEETAEGGTEEEAKKKSED